MQENRLLDFGKAWKNGNIKKVLSFFTDDCIYMTSVGAEPGTTFIGREDVKKGIEKMMGYDNTVSSTIKNINIYGNFGFWEWEYKFPDGEIILGCDVFEFEDNLIKKKNAFRKVKNEKK